MKLIIRALVAGVGALALAVAIGVVSGGPSGTSTAATPPQAIDGRALSGAATDRAAVIAHIRKLSVIRSLVRIEAKYTTWAEAARLLRMEGRPVDFTDATPVWVVAVSGNVIGMVDPHGEVFSWAAYTIDARNGLVRAEVANNDAPWPAGFTSIVDRGQP
jgi:hypothetical protein